MCRSIKPLFNFEPGATDEEIRNASLQYVRKLSGFTKPSSINEKAFEEAVEKITADTKILLHSLVTNSPKKDREEEAAKAKERSEKRFNTSRE
jgi:hypothetical protein